VTPLKQSSVPTRLSFIISESTKAFNHLFESLNKLIFEGGYFTLKIINTDQAVGVVAVSAEFQSP
jgi:hypothetical protein